MDHEAYLKFSTKAQIILIGRYKECDTEGHKKPNNNHCDYCYRTIDVPTHRVDAIREERKNLPLMMRPLDAPLMIKKAEEERERQRWNDRLDGIEKVIEELSEKAPQ